MVFDLVSIGEVMAEIRRQPGSDFKVGFAGDTYNTAVYCARALKQPARVAYMTRIGTDPLSKALVDVSKSEGLNTDSFRLDSFRKIGIYTVENDLSGERTFAYWRDASAARLLFSTIGDTDAIPQARITYLSGITLAILPPSARSNLLSTLRRLKHEGRTKVAFDSNYRSMLWESADIARSVIAEMWDLADIALPSLEDEMDLFGTKRESDVLKRFETMDFKACAIKRGDRGPVSPHLALGDHPDFPAAQKVIDTTAAGDSFNGAYLAAYLKGEAETECLREGHLLASRVVAERGAIVPLG